MKLKLIWDWRKLIGFLQNFISLRKLTGDLIRPKYYLVWFFFFHPVSFMGFQFEYRRSEFCLVDPGFDNFVLAFSVYPFSFPLFQCWNLCYWGMMIILHCIWVLCRFISLSFVCFFFLQLWKSVLQWKRCASFVGQWGVEVGFMYTAHPIPNTSNAKAYQRLQVKVLLLPCKYFHVFWFGRSQLLVYECTFYLFKYSVKVEDFDESCLLPLKRVVA